MLDHDEIERGDGDFSAGAALPGASPAPADPEARARAFGTLREAHRRESEKLLREVRRKDAFHVYLVSVKNPEGPDKEERIYRRPDYDGMRTAAMTLKYLADAARSLYEGSETPEDALRVRFESGEEWTG